MNQIKRTGMVMAGSLLYGLLWVGDQSPFPSFTSVLNPAVFYFYVFYTCLIINIFPEYFLKELSHHAIIRLKKHEYSS